MKNMNRKKLLGLLTISTDVTAIITATILSITSRFQPIPVYTIPIINLTLSRWWDIALAPLTLNLYFLLIFLFAEENTHIESLIQNLEKLDSSGVYVALGIFTPMILMLIGIICGLINGFGIGLLVISATWLLLIATHLILQIKNQLNQKLNPQ